jgi:peptide/nickel transport system substrate-binding protein
MKLRFIQISAFTTASALFLSACGGGAIGGQASEKRGGTLYIYNSSDESFTLDPQRNYSRENMAFAGSFLIRTLTQYTVSNDDVEASALVADAATDIGTTSNAGKTWTFSLRDGMKWEDGKEVLCEDFKYGISRSFATDVITGGSIYPRSLLNVVDYKGPYVDDSAGQASFDSAVVCEGNTITFTLLNPMSDFNYAVSLTAFGAVREDLDTREMYENAIASNGPYKISSYVKGEKLVLIRNENWASETDEIRKAYPDQIEYSFDMSSEEITSALIADEGDAKNAISVARVEPDQIANVFNDAKFDKRRIDFLDSFTRYFAINTKKVPNLAHRQAILAAVDREEILTLSGGFYAGELADGVVSPNIGMDYNPTGIWDELLGASIPATGDAEYAISLIDSSGEPFPQPFVIDYVKTELNDRVVSSIVTSLGRAGIKATLNPIEQSSYFSTVFNPDLQGSLTASAWVPDWSNASTIIPELFSTSGFYNLSQYNNREFTAESDAAKVVINRSEQAAAWHSLSKQSMELALVLPTLFGKSQRMFGSNVDGAFIWGPYGAWSYSSISVK